MLDPDVVLRADTGRVFARARPPRAAAVARAVLLRGSRFAPLAQLVVLNDAAGLVVAFGRRPFAVVEFTVEGRILAIDLILDPDRLRALVVDE